MSAANPQREMGQCEQTGTAQSYVCCSSALCDSADATSP